MLVSAGVLLEAPPASLADDATGGHAGGLATAASPRLWDANNAAAPSCIVAVSTDTSCAMLSSRMMPAGSGGASATGKHVSRRAETGRRDTKKSVSPESSVQFTPTYQYHLLIREYQLVTAPAQGNTATLATTHEEDNERT